jgi:hypothetical protein
MLDLKITNRRDLLNIEVLDNAYQPVLNSLNALAKGQGFASDTKLRSSCPIHRR